MKVPGYEIQRGQTLWENTAEPVIAAAETMDAHGQGFPSSSHMERDRLPLKKPVLFWGL